MSNRLSHPVIEKKTRIASIDRIAPKGAKLVNSVQLDLFGNGRRHYLMGVITTSTLDLKSPLQCKRVHVFFK